MPYGLGKGRFEGATGTYDMVFRKYDLGVNRILARDLYGALNDMALGADRAWQVVCGWDCG